MTLVKKEIDQVTCYPQMRVWSFSICWNRLSVCTVPTVGARQPWALIIDLREVFHKKKMKVCLLSKLFQTPPPSNFFWIGVWPPPPFRHTFIIYFYGRPPLLDIKLVVYKMVLLEKTWIEILIWFIDLKKIYNQQVPLIKEKKNR